MNCILEMKCGDNKKCSKVQRKNAKQEQSKHGPLQKLEVGSGGMKESAFSAERS